MAVYDPETRSSDNNKQKPGDMDPEFAQAARTVRALTPRKPTPLTIVIYGWWLFFGVMLLIDSLVNEWSSYMPTEDVAPIIITYIAITLTTGAANCILSISQPRLGKSWNTESNGLTLVFAAQIALMIVNILNEPAAIAHWGMALFFAIACVARIKTIKKEEMSLRAAARNIDNQRIESESTGSHSAVIPMPFKKKTQEGSVV